MGFDPDKNHRRSIRLAKYDYSQAGAYFVTICTRYRECLFGEVIAGEMKLNAFGQIVVEEWFKTGVIRPRIRSDAFMVMPNHVHGILVIDDGCCRGTLDGRGTLHRAPTTTTIQRSHIITTQHVPTVERFGKPTPDSIPTIVRLFKSAATKQINELRQMPGVAVWQRNYYEHIIRNDTELGYIREYIATNPARWAEDRENPDGKTKTQQQQR
ncbi:transposase [bacterium]|nr:transposase [bacterium]